MKKTLVVLVILGIGWWIISPLNKPSYNYSPSSYTSSGDSEETVDRYDALTDNWDEIKEHLDGTITIEACSDSSGNCYDLDADISNGDIDTIYFSNGGYLYFGAELDYNGEADGYDDDGNYWTFKLDRSYIDNALDEWADNNRITLE